MTDKTKSNARPLPVSLAEVALIDAAMCAAAGAMSVSWWHEQVRLGHAPPPTIRRPRCTRWRLVDVSAFWARISAEGANDANAGECVTARAKRASSKAREVAAAANAAATHQSRNSVKQ